MLNHRSTRHPWLIEFAADFAAIVGAYYLALLVRFYSSWGGKFFAAINRALGVRDTAETGPLFREFYAVSALRIILLLTVVLCVLYALLDLYPGRRFIRWRPVAWNILLANFIALAGFYAYFYLRRNVFHPRSFVATVIAFNAIFAISFRAVVRHTLRALRTRGWDDCPCVLAGTGSRADALAAYLDMARPHGMRVAEHVRSDADEDFGVLAERVRTAAARHGARMLISANESMPVESIMAFLEVADSLQLPAKILSEALRVIPNQGDQAVDMLQGMPFVHFDVRSRGRYITMQRVLSVGAALILLVVLAPFFAVVSALIRLTSRGPALFVQERIGVNRKPFRMWKFRTMHDRAEQIQAELEALNESGQGLFKIRKDPRVTPVGRFLRRFSLDELPQLVNVLKGEMVVVGPRPLPRRDFENYYEEWHYARHAGLPGLTCLWQTSGRSEIDFHNMCILDVFYLHNRSWVMDLKVLLKTLWVVVFAKGAY